MRKILELLLVFLAQNIITSPLVHLGKKVVNMQHCVPWVAQEVPGCAWQRAGLTPPSLPVCSLLYGPSGYRKQIVVVAQNQFKHCTESLSIPAPGLQQQQELSLQPGMGSPILQQAWGRRKLGQWPSITRRWVGLTLWWQFRKTWDRLGTEDFPFNLLYVLAFQALQQ